MKTNLRYCLLLFLTSFLVSSCTKEDDDNVSSEQSERYANFDLTGGPAGYYEGENTLIAVYEQPESGTQINWSSTRPSGEEPFWRLDFTSVEGAVEQLVPGTYALGSIDDADNGLADFTLQFQLHTANSFPSLWGALGAVDGTLTITEVQTGFFDNGTRDLVLGSFEFTASDNNINQPELDDIVVTNGEFRAKMGTF